MSLCALQIFATQHEQQHAPKVRLLVIWFGANDAAVPPKEQHVPLARYKANLAKLIWMVSSPESPRYSPATRVVLLTPPPVNTLQWSVRQASKDPPQGLDRDFEVTRTYAEAAKEVGEAEGVPVVDVWTRFWEGAGRVEAELKKYLTDGLHLIEEGYAVGGLRSSRACACVWEWDADENVGRLRGAHEDHCGEIPGVSP